MPKGASKDEASLEEQSRTAQNSTVQHIPGLPLAWPHRSPQAFPGGVVFHYFRFFIVSRDYSSHLREVTELFSTNDAQEACQLSLPPPPTASRPLGPPPPPPPPASARGPAQDVRSKLGDGIRSAAWHRFPLPLGFCRDETGSQNSARECQGRALGARSGLGYSKGVPTKKSPVL
jgi:hypothetical protein